MAGAIRVGGRSKRPCLAEIEAGRDDATGDALGLGVRGALDRARLPWLLRHAISPALERQHFAARINGELADLGS
jgi:hypothetical protein